MKISESTDWLTKPSVLWRLLFATVAIGVGIALWKPATGGDLLDRIASVEAVVARLAEMSDEEQKSHFWLTLSLDMIFPFAYGFLMIGLPLKFFSRPMRILAIPALLAIPFDLTENTIQLMALSGNETWLPMKEFVTPAKWIAVVIASAISIAALAIYTYKRLPKS